MLDQILSAVKGQVGDVLAEKNVSTDKLDDVLKLSGESVKDGVLSEASSGNLDGVLSLFKGNSEVSTSNPIVSTIVTSLTGKLVGALGLDQGKAGGLAASVVPMIVQMVVSKFQGSDKDASAEGITSFLGGMDSDDLMNKAKGMLGGLFN